MDKNKIEQKKPDSNQKGVEEDSPLRLTADLEGSYLFSRWGKCSPGCQDAEEEDRSG